MEAKNDQGASPSGPSGGWLKSRRSAGAIWLTLGGQWVAETAGRLDRELHGLDVAGLNRADLDLSAVKRLDAAGAWLILRTQAEFRKKGIETAVSGASAAHTSLLETVARQDVSVAPPALRRDRLFAAVEGIGKTTVELLLDARDLLNFLGLTAVTVQRTLLRPGRVRIASLTNQMQLTGFNALPIVGLLSFLIGVVTAYQSVDQLARFGAQIFTVNIVGIGILREMGILITAIIVAGRSGSAFTAQIGTMKVNEEVEAMQTIGLDPMEVLVLPRVIALVIVMPLLTFYADILGILGGAAMAVAKLDMTLLQFVRQLQTAVSITSFWVGILKAPLFGFVIALVGCFEGLMVTRSAESVGSHTTKAVVEAVFLIIVLDAFLSIFFSAVNM